MSAPEIEDQKFIQALKGLFGPDKIQDIPPLTPERREKLQEMVNKAMRILTPREEKAIRMRFGIGVKSDHALEEVGQGFPETRERLGQIEAKALLKLRNPGNARKKVSKVRDN